MKNKKALSVLILTLLVLIFFTACGKPNEEKIRNKMEKELLAEYGEPFIVENIGLREANGVKFYQAQIYPKSIIGTPKENDKYYHSTASVDVSRLNSKNSVGNSYGTIKMNDEAEEYLLPKAKELFGDRIRIKAEIEYKEKDGDYYTTYLENGFISKKELVKKDPNKYRIELTLYLYIFDKIDNEKEKEERRKPLFEFLKYLRAEKLDEYLEIFMVFTDDIVLAPSFEKYKYDLEKIKEIEPLLRDEISKMSENKVLENMNLLMKNDLGIENNNLVSRYLQAYYMILTMELLKVDQYGRYNEAKEKHTVERHYYKNASDIEFSYIDKYIFKKESN